LWSRSRGRRRWTVIISGIGTRIRDLVGGIWTPVLLCTDGVLAGIHWELWEPSIVEPEEIIPKRSGRSFEIPVEIGSIGRHLHQRKVVHPVLLFNCGKGFGSRQNGIDLVGHRPFSDDRGKSLGSDLVAKCRACDLDMGRIRCAPESFVKAVVDVDVHSDILVCVGIRHPIGPLVRLERMVLDDHHPRGWKISPDDGIRLCVERLDHVDPSIESP